MRNFALVIIFAEYKFIDKFLWKLIIYYSHSQLIYVYWIYIFLQRIVSWCVKAYNNADILDKSTVAINTLYGIHYFKVDECP